MTVRVTLLDLRLGLVTLTHEQQRALAEKAVPILARSVVRRCHASTEAGSEPARTRPHRS